MRRLTLGLAIFALVGCGSSIGAGVGGEDGKSAADILKDAKAAMSQASSFKLTATIKSAEGPSTLVLQSDGKGNAKGSGTVMNARVELVIKDGKSYLRSKEFFAKMIA